jgi:hypothetical protein
VIESWNLYLYVYVYKCSCRQYYVPKMIFNIIFKIKHKLYIASGPACPQGKILGVHLFLKGPSVVQLFKTIFYTVLQHGSYLETTFGFQFTKI